ncbi:cell division protein FtsZ [Desulfolithobacter dissulfuricans]|uniref:Cell division protein FtsZ n=1 Tax=Desulfolithobacter dissulfuricans TaxID=2795293 RepID=A0A915XIY1_9BACT|nr:cell division protein FtsZ [Desulfolithobacter dissulfuricans]BCO09685.1 cell division protein FtsZ [Desulfolithobacter dissulfuricans]
MPFRMAEEESVAVIKVIGVGGGGGNAINSMVENRLKGVEFIAANTDLQALEKSRADIRLQLGPGITKGMGAGADPEKGREAAQESQEDIQNALAGADMVFITAGLGGGTGTGGAPVIAKLSKEMGALTVAVVTKPFYFEARKRMRNAEAGWEELKKYADTIITVPNDRLLSLMQTNSTLVDMMKMVDNVLLQAVKGITDLINLPGHINVDFADLKTVMKEVGPAIMGSGAAVGENRAAEAAKRAIDNQLLEDVGIDGAKGILINISATESSLTMAEFMEASALIQDKAHEDANIIIGALFDEGLGDELRVTVIATGISSIEDSETISSLDVSRSRRQEKAKPQQTTVLPLEERVVGAEDLSPKAVSPAKPNPVPRTRSMPTPIFDEHEHDDWDEPAYIRKKAN